jgi:hypothetical protein
MKKLVATRRVVVTARPNTVWMEILSKAQARDDLFDRWRQGSPNVFASAPHPHIHEQYQRFPYLIVSTGTRINEAARL